jgi:hypothetical protein
LRLRLQVQSVPLLVGGPAPNGKYSCTVKANEPLYLVGLSDECSTDLSKGRHTIFGVSKGGKQRLSSTFTTVAT